MKTQPQSSCAAFSFGSPKDSADSGSVGEDDSDEDTDGSGRVVLVGLLEERKGFRAGMTGGMIASPWLKP